MKTHCFICCFVLLPLALLSPHSRAFLYPRVLSRKTKTTTTRELPSSSPSCILLLQRCGNNANDDETECDNDNDANNNVHISNSDFGCRFSSPTSSQSTSSKRRLFLNSLLMVATSTVSGTSSCLAGEVGAQITKAVTTSDLGISVRTSVVKGAQLMNQIDGQWERFSDQFGLGTERSKQAAKPKPKQIPDPLPLDITMASVILKKCNQVFLLSTNTNNNIRPETLSAQISKVANLVRVSFERSGVVGISKENPLQFENASQFNFVLYSHYRAYLDLIVDNNINFASFRSKFEDVLGQELLSILLPSAKTTMQSLQNDNNVTKEKTLEVALQLVDDFCEVWRDKGFVSQVERSPIDEEKIADWLEDISDLELTIALDGDVTLNAQILLQEQGFRLYPNLARYVVVYGILQPILGTSYSQKVSGMDYYFDTDYNSDPEKFEVKEVLLTIQIENT